MNEPHVDFDWAALDHQQEIARELDFQAIKSLLAWIVEGDNQGAKEGKKLEAIAVRVLAAAVIVRTGPQIGTATQISKRYGISKARLSKQVVKLRTKGLNNETKRI